MLKHLATSAFIPGHHMRLFKGNLFRGMIVASVLIFLAEKANHAAVRSTLHSKCC